MIYIEEKPTKKVPGLTSLFITFKYNPRIIDIIKSTNTAIFDKKAVCWEVPTIYLQTLIDQLCVIDDIDLKLLKTNISAQPEVDLKLSEYKTMPFDYQVEGIKYGLSKEKWLLLDGCGLGKSLQLIIIAGELKRLGKISHCLVICGINNLKSNWLKEISKHSNLTATVLGRKVSAKGKVTYGSIKDRVNILKNPIDEFFVISNIETFRNDDIIKAINKGPNKFDLIIIDEIHTIRTVSSAQGSNILKLKDSKYRIGATGTLLLNDPLDCYAPMKWIGIEKSAASTFEYFYYNYGGAFGNTFKGYKNLDVLKEQLGEFSLRRTKDVLPNLPPKTVINEYIEMDDKQAEFYNNLKRGIRDQVDKVKISTANLLSMIIRLRQATSCPSILTTENIESAKVKRAVDLARQLVSGGEKVVIFTGFIATANKVAEMLSDLNPLVCTGETPQSEIDKNRDLFQSNPDYKIFVGTWQKCGTGIDLNAASYEICTESSWTSGQNTQTEDRIHRANNTKPAFIYYLITKDTIDEKVMNIVNNKAAMSSFIIDDSIPPEYEEELRKYILELS